MANNKNNLKNLIPFQKGKSGNPNGRPKGRKSLSTIVSELENEEYNWSRVPTKGPELDEYFKEVGAPWRAIVMAAMLQAINGDKDAREWLRKSGYGDKMDDKPAETEVVEPLIISTIKKRHVTPEAETTDSS